MLHHFGLDLRQGLQPDAVRQAQAEHGANALPEPPPKPLWRTFARQFKSPLIYILFVAAVLAVALGHRGDALVILAVVLVNALIGSFQEGRAERSMAALRRLAALHVRVLRDGGEQVIEARELVPGDIMLLAAGDAVAADARLVEEAQLQVAEAALTGESVPVSKSIAAVPEATGLADRHCMVYSGTHVTAGRARAVVAAIGTHTEVGRIAGLTEGAEEPKTPLELRLEQFGRALVAAALGLFVLVVLLGLWRALPLSEVLMVAISQMVSMVPEGLPVAITIALAVGMQRMADRGAIIRRLSAVETLGSTTVICSDKTGTLTRNEMTAVALWLPGGRQFGVGGIGYVPEGAIDDGGRPADLADPALRDLCTAAALCNDSELLAPEDERVAWTVLGDPTEGALLVLARKAGLSIEDLRRTAPREAELPFDSDTKLMATRHRMDAAPRRVWIKGAPEAVLRQCAAVGTEVLQAARDAAEGMATQALRVLAFATPDDDPLDADAGFDALAGRARLLGLVGQIDPPTSWRVPRPASCAEIRPHPIDARNRHASAPPHPGHHRLLGPCAPLRGSRRTHRARDLGALDVDACDAGRRAAGASPMAGHGPRTGTAVAGRCSASARPFGRRPAGEPACHDPPAPRLWHGPRRDRPRSRCDGCRPAGPGRTWSGIQRRLVLGSTSERLLRRTTLPLLAVRQTPHEPYRRVLVTLDFSPWSERAVALARRVAPNARLLLFNAYQVPFEEELHFAGVDAATVDHYRQQARTSATQRVHALATACGLPSGHWEPCIVEGDASQRIIEHEQDKDVDLVVLGKHGQSATEDLLLGSVSRHVLAEGSVDVLVSTAREA